MASFSEVHIVGPGLASSDDEEEQWEEEELDKGRVCSTFGARLSRFHTALLLDTSPRISEMTQLFFVEQ